MGKVMTKVISGFPAVGKSYLYNNNKGLKVLDSDSRKFSWESEGVRHPEFPNNYIRHIKRNLGVVDVIFVSSHKVVREALENNGIDYTIVYPNISLKGEYISRYINRGNDDNFIEFLNDNWEEFITDIENERFPVKVELQEGQYMKDVLEHIL